MPKLYPTTITITQEGVPLEGALVQLVSEDPALVSWGPGGITDSAGVSIMRTNSKYTGAPIGTFKVLVSKRATEPHPHPEWASLPDGDPKFQQYSAMVNKLKVYDYVDPKFAKLAETTLSVDIVKGKNAITLDAGKPIKVVAKGVM